MNGNADHPILTGLHLLLTLQCNFECDHCFVWGSPWLTETFTISEIRNVLEQARRMNTVEQIYFEGGEPFLYYSTLLNAVKLAYEAGFQVGVVSNGYWAISEEDAVECLRPFAGLLSDLSVSSDLFHYSHEQSAQSHFAASAAARLGIPSGMICIAQPESTSARSSLGMIDSGNTTEGSRVMCRGRAAKTLAKLFDKQPAEKFNFCPHEDLQSPGRVHMDPMGNLFICQGILIGNIYKQPLQQVWENFDPERHPIIGPLIVGGPAELARRYGVDTSEGFADACHLCYHTRSSLRMNFPEILGPDQMYGVESGESK